MNPVTSPPPSSHRTVGAFLAHDGVPIGFIAVSVMLGTYGLLDLVPSVPLLGAAFCGTALIYQFDRCLGFSPEDRYNRPGHRAWLRGHRTYVRSASIVLLVIGTVALIWLQPRTVGAAAALGVLGILYVVPSSKQGWRLKSAWWMKPVAVSGAWVLGGVVLPVLEAGTEYTVGVAALVGYRMVIVLANTLLADLGDRHGDAQVGLRTVATESTPRRLRNAVRGLLATTLVVGLGVAAWGRMPLLGVDLLGLIPMLVLVGRIEAPMARGQRLAVDAVVAWPLVTALAAWLTGAW